MEDAWTAWGALTINSTSQRCRPTCLSFMNDKIKLENALCQGLIDSSLEIFFFVASAFFFTNIIQKKLLFSVTSLVRKFKCCFKFSMASFGV